MRLPNTSCTAASLVVLLAMSTTQGSAQEPAPSPQVSPAPPSAVETTSSPQVSPAQGPHTYIVPAGTKVLLQLRSAVNTKSAKPGDGVYLISSFPVIVGNRVMVPAGVFVQGMVDRVERAGRMKGRAQLDMHFTSMIFPNGSVVEIPGMVNSLPGADKQEVKDDGEGTIEQQADKTRNMGTVAKVGIPTGATIGTIAGHESGRALAGGLAGIGAGLAAAGIASLFTRGADVNIVSGTQVEMVLQRPLMLVDANLATSTADGAPPELQPSPNQPRPIQKPNPKDMVCPPGGLGCE